VSHLGTLRAVNAWVHDCVDARLETFGVSCGTTPTYRFAPVSARLTSDAARTI